MILIIINDIYVIVLAVNNFIMHTYTPMYTHVYVHMDMCICIYVCKRITSVGVSFEISRI